MNEQDRPRELKTEFKRSKLCRTIHADGAWGSLTPQGFVHMAIYSEHRAFPSGTTIRGKSDGTIEEIPASDPGFLVREIEADLLLTESTATSLRNWLSDRLDDIARFKQQVEEEQPSS